MYRDTFFASAFITSSASFAFASASADDSFSSASSRSHFARSPPGRSSRSARLTTMCLGATAMDGPARLFEREAHHRFVDRADLLDVQRPVREALAVEDEQILQHAEDDAVGDARRIDTFALDAPGIVRTAFEERIRVGIEQRPCRAVNFRAPWPPPS